MSKTLRLLAETPEDVPVLSAALQDGVLKVGDIAYDAKARRFSVELNRFRWEEAAKRGPFHRARAALAVESVLSVQSAKVSRGDKNAVAVILALAFEPDPEPPGGVLRLTLAGGGEFKLKVECLDVLLLDTGPVWATPHKPFHGAR